MYRPQGPYTASRWVAHNSTSDRSHNPSSDYDFRGGEEEQFPLDAFDRQLLAEIAPNQGAGLTQNAAQNATARPRAYSSLRSARDFKDDLQRSQLPAYAGSSTDNPISSPVISSLQAKHERSTRANHEYGVSNALLPRESIVQPASRTSFSACQQDVRRDLSRAPIVQGIQLVPTSQLPDNMRSLYNFPIFNAIQSKCFRTAYEGDDNIVLSAPTGSGKTVVLELAICRLLRSQDNAEFKVVYQAPTKSLCGERYRDWSAKFKTLGLQCAELTGDSEFVNLRNVQRAHIIITTPEKWDSATRKWKDNAKLMRMIKLFLIDEVHILKESRGATLEAIVSRMKSVGAGVRFVALSATIPNSDDIATWLRLNHQEPDRPAHREVFGESFRPVTLEKHVLGFQSPPNDFILDTILTKEIPRIIARYSKRKPVMIFCATRKIAATQAAKLADLWRSTTASERLWNGPNHKLKAVDDGLKGCIDTGVAFHHSGLDQVDRQTVENGFLQGDISIICSTSTLAVGINLPCYLVILKGTSAYSDDGLQEYTSLEVMQMLGRAGRPQFEKSACAVILTNKNNTERYGKMISGNEMVESCLHQNLIEHINAEIGIGTVHDMSSAKRWLQGTFLNVRLRQNPQHYRLTESNGFLNVESLLEDLCEKDVNLLVEAKLVEMTRAGFRGTEFGEIMARYYVRYETMKKFSALSRPSKMSEILYTLTQASEFNELRWRAGERTFYKQINKTSEIRFPVKVDVALAGHKACLIAQMNLGGSVMDKEATKKHSSQFKQDSRVVLSHCNRLIRCIIDMQVVLKDAVTLHNALELARSLAAGVWDNTPMQLKQVSGVGDITTRRLAAAGIKNMDALLNAEPHEIDLALGKTQPFGSNLLKKASAFPNLRISVHEISRQVKPDQGVKLRIRCEVGYLNSKPPLYFNSKAIFIVFSCETSNGDLVEFRRFSAKKLCDGENIMFDVLLDKPTAQLNCHVMCDELAGSHRFAELKLDIPVTLFPKPTQSESRPVDLIANNSATFDVHEDEFNDSTLADDDLLAAEADLRDNTSSFEPGEGPSVRGTKRKLESPSSTQEVPSHWRKPEQLKNGNWTCQHTCNDEGKDCHHACCKDGVKKPRRRPSRPAQKAKSDQSREKDADRRSPKRSGVGDTRNVSQKALESKAKHRINDIGTLLTRNQKTTQCAAVLELPSSSSESDENEMDYFDPVECDWNVTERVDLTDPAAPKYDGIGSVVDDDSNISPMKLFCSTGSDQSPIKTSTFDSAGLIDRDRLPMETFDDLSDLSDIDLSAYDDTVISGNRVAARADIPQYAHPQPSNLSIKDRQNSPPTSCIRSNQSKECEEQRAKRAHCAEQKKKWEEFDPTLFELFGHCIDLI